ncbi:uncharacterized mitochondrial protein AtMg00810-like [Macadamia integrifolia]|uniref:uncharacterized mitochondrial protein AtMg00810-like n=1 Tax=Macadamia integrifolia TaxID=60698 RepID=UPI001C4FF7FA|nr:uncharacterized mitochondrial protein AtMg00810-like [Macadamia integrifolia]
MAFPDSFVVDLGSRFAMKDLGALHYFLGIEVSTTAQGLFLSQAKYAHDILPRAYMGDIKPMSTPMALRSDSTTSKSFPDVTLYRSLVGALQYLTITCPDISYAVNSVCQFMHAPTIAHFCMVKRILRYVRGMIDHGLRIAGCPVIRHSTTGFCTFLGANCISWSAKKQPIVARSSTEAEYCAMATTTAKLTWLSSLLRDIGIPQLQPVMLFGDNLSALHMTVNPVFHARTKHVELDYHFVLENVALGLLVTRFVPSHHQLADVFTKPLGRRDFLHICIKLRQISPMDECFPTVRKRLFGQTLCDERLLVEDEEDAHISNNGEELQEPLPWQKEHQWMLPKKKRTPEVVSAKWDY